MKQLKSLCLVSRSIYPDHISEHTQNISTFSGFLIFWDKVHVFAQTNLARYSESNHNAIYGYFIPVKGNKYFNFLFFFIFGLRKIIKKNKSYKFDLFQGSDPAGAFLAYIASTIFKKKFLFEVQGDIFGYPAEVGGKLHSTLVKSFSKFLVKKADYIRVVSPWLMEYLLELGVDEKKIFVVYPRCNSSLFNINKVEKKRPECFKRARNLIFIGNLIKSKGVNYLIDAFSMVLKKNHDIGLIIVGSGEDEKTLREQAENLQIENEISFTEKIEYSLIPTYLFYSDILILPSIEEGFGRVLIEAMAMGTNVIGSNVGGIPLLIDNKVNGLIFESRNSCDLFEKISTILENKDFAKQLINNANKDFKSKYDYDISMKNFIQMYHKIMEE